MNRLSLIALGCSVLACLLLWHLWQDASERAEEAELTVARLRQANEAALSALELRDRLGEVLDELKRIDDGQPVNDGLLETINLIAKILNGMKGESAD